MSEQVSAEGALMRPSDSLRTKKHASSGSTGAPVEFFATEMNARYGQVRSYAQYLIEGRDLSLNRTRIVHYKYQEAKDAGVDPAKGFTLRMGDDWLNSLGRLFAGGSNKTIRYWHPVREALFDELAKHDVGYMVALPSLLDSLFADQDIAVLKQMKTELFIPIGEAASEALVSKLRDAAIPTRAGYSCEEVGPLASECSTTPGSYHVAHSNVLVEADTANAVSVDNATLSPVLVTGLHAYATPFVRYDVGDLAVIDEGCACGHEGTTLSRIVGRSKNLIKHADGHFSLFLMRPFDIQKIAPVREYRVRQTGLEKIAVEIGGGGPLSEDQHSRLALLIGAHAGGDFHIEVNSVDAIDWGSNQKRLAFINELL